MPSSDNPPDGAVTKRPRAARPKRPPKTSEAPAGDTPDVILYCDGACSPNPGLGGWGVVLVAPGHGGRRKELSGAEPDTTNNRMELRAAIEGLRALKRPSRVRIVTDSQYLKHAFTQGWLERWQRNGWRTAGRQPVQNVDLWQALAEAIAPHRVEWVWVRGHGSEAENRRSDRLAVEARRKLAEASGAVEATPPAPGPSAPPSDNTPSGGRR